MLHEIRTRDGACETYWLETSASRGRVVPRAYAIAILALARRHGFRYQRFAYLRGIDGNLYRDNPHKIGMLLFVAGPQRALTLRPYTGNALIAWRGFSIMRSSTKATR